MSQNNNNSSALNCLMEKLLVKKANDDGLGWLIPILKDADISLLNVSECYEPKFIDFLRMFIPNDKLCYIKKIDQFFKTIHNEYKRKTLNNNPSTNTNGTNVVHSSHSHVQNAELDGGNEDEDEDDEEEDSSSQINFDSELGTLKIEQDETEPDEDGADLSLDGFDVGCEVDCEPCTDPLPIGVYDIVRRYPPPSTENLLPEHRRYGQIRPFKCTEYRLPDFSDEIRELEHCFQQSAPKNGVIRKVVEKIFQQLLLTYFVYAIPDQIGAFVCMLTCYTFPVFALDDDPRPERDIFKKLRNKYSNYRTRINRSKELNDYTDSVITKRKQPIQATVNSTKKRKLKNQLLASDGMAYQI